MGFFHFFFIGDFYGVSNVQRSFSLNSRILNEDCVTGMQKLPDGCIDLVVTDPPFAIDFKKTKANYNRKESNVLEGYEDIKPRDYLKFSLEWMDEAHRLLKTNGSMYVVAGYNNLDVVLQSLKFNGFHIQNHIIWKFQFGVRTKNKFVTSHYHILFMTKRKMIYDFYPNNRFSDTERTDAGGSARYKDMEDVWYIQREYWTGQKKTPTKLPQELIKKILGYSSKEGDMILDPFIGSGQVALVAKQMKRKYIGYEIVKGYYDFARSRLASLKY